MDNLGIDNQSDFGEAFGDLSMQSGYEVNETKEASDVIHKADCVFQREAVAGIIKMIDERMLTMEDKQY
jgi:hypothetical protein